MMQVKTITVETSAPYDVICSTIPTAVQSLNYIVLHQYNLNELLKSLGESPPSKNVSVFEICKPSEIARLLNMEVTLAHIIPCRIVVFTDPSSKRTIIQYVRPYVVLSLFNATEDETTKIATQIETDLSTMIKIAEHHAENIPSEVVEEKSSTASTINSASIQPDSTSPQ